MAQDTTSRTAAETTGRSAAVRAGTAGRLRRGAMAVMAAAPLLFFVAGCDEPGNWVVKSINKSSETVDCVDKDKPEKTREVSVSNEVLRSIKVGEKCPEDGGRNGGSRG
ncbi:hypothetical protein [Amycolatopsis minnesotensis]